MNAHQAIAFLEAKGVHLSLGDGDKITVQFPSDCSRGLQEEKMMEVLRSDRQEAIRILRLRKYRLHGFEQAEPLSGTHTLKTSNLQHALQLGEAIKAGLAALDGPVIYDISSKEITITYQPLVPLDWVHPDHQVE
jgi:hypothetical protein